MVLVFRSLSSDAVIDWRLRVSRDVVWVICDLKLVNMLIDDPHKSFTKVEIKNQRIFFLAIIVIYESLILQ